MEMQCPHMTTAPAVTKHIIVKLKVLLYNLQFPLTFFGHKLAVDHFLP